MKQKKNLFGAIFALLFALALTTLGSTTVHATIETPKDHVSYFTEKTISVHYGSFQIKGMKKNQKIVSLKSSNTNILRPDGAWRYEDGRVLIGYFYFKPGTVTISFKIEGKTYRTKVYLKEYVNPVKTCSISGISKNGQKDLASLTKQKNSCGKLKCIEAKSRRVQASAKEGWKIQEIQVGKRTPKTYKKPVQKIDYKYNTVEQQVVITYINSKDNGTIKIYYDWK